MQLFTIIQDSSAYDAGSSIGFTIGKYLPLILLIVIAFVIFIN